MATLKETADAFAGIIADYDSGTITEAQAAQQLLLAFAGFLPVSQIQMLTEKVVGAFARLDNTLVFERAPAADEGTLGAVFIDLLNMQLYGPKDPATKPNGGWGLPRPLIGAEGLSALAVVIAAGELPANATADDFASWLANSQSAVIQPLLDAAVVARDEAVAAAQQTGQDRAATAADAQATAADRTAAQEAATAAAADAQQTAQDRAATTADAQATAADRTATGALRDEAQQLRDETQQLRDEAGEIVGGDFLTEAQADALYRKLGQLLAIADVDGLGAALNGKVTTQQLNDAIQAVVGMAPADLDTLKEIADRLVDAEGDYAALVGVIAGKASQASLDALVARVAALEGKPQPVLTINGQAPDQSGAITLQVSAGFNPAQALAAFDAA